jgi:putative ABC transport system permease protein
MRMRAVLRLAACELRGRWLSWAVLVLLVGLAGGVVLTAVAGAQRTDSAYPRFLAVYRASDVLVSPADSGVGGYDDALARLPSVAAIAPLVGLQALPLEPGGRLDAAAVVAAPLDNRYGRTLEIPKMLSGRMPGPDRPGEVAIDQIAAQDLHLRVGSTPETGAVSAGNLRHIRRPGRPPGGAITPVSLLLTVPAAILAAIAIALPAGRRCARLSPATVLRSE